AGERNAQRDEDRERRDPVDQAEDERAADESAERSVRALTEELSLAPQLGSQRGDESLPQTIAVYQHDERDDEDQREVEEHVRDTGNEPERVAGDRSGDLGDLRRDLAVQVRHVDRKTRAF